MLVKARRRVLMMGKARRRVSMMGKARKARTLAGSLAASYLTSIYKNSFLKKNYVFFQVQFEFSSKKHAAQNKCQIFSFMFQQSACVSLCLAEP